MQNTRATWILICWEPPVEVDFPISHYEVLARDTNGIYLVNTSIPDNSTFNNVTDLLHDTTYNFTVVAVIQADEVVARSAESVPLGDNITTTSVGMFTE